MSSESWRQSMTSSQSKDLNPLLSPQTMGVPARRLTSPRSERQYKHRFKRWGFEKNITHSKMQAISRKRSERLLLEQKETVFSNYGQPINPDKIDRWEQRHNNPTADGAQSSAPTPPGITYHTTVPTVSSPPPDSPPSNHNLNPQAPAAAFGYQQVGNAVAPSLIARLMLSTT